MKWKEWTKKEEIIQLFISWVYNVIEKNRGYCQFSETPNDLLHISFDLLESLLMLFQLFMLVFSIFFSRISPEEVNNNFAIFLSYTISHVLLIIQATTEMRYFPSVKEKIKKFMDRRMSLLKIQREICSMGWSRSVPILYLKHHIKEQQQ